MPAVLPTTGFEPSVQMSTNYKRHVISYYYYEKSYDFMEAPKRASLGPYPFSKIMDHTLRAATAAKFPRGLSYHYEYPLLDSAAFQLERSVSGMPSHGHPDFKPSHSFHPTLELEMV